VAIPTQDVTNAVKPSFLLLFLGYSSLPWLWFISHTIGQTAIFHPYPTPHMPIQKCHKMLNHVTAHCNCLSMCDLLNYTLFHLHTSQYYPSDWHISCQTYTRALISMPRIKPSSLILLLELFHVSTVSTHTVPLNFPGSSYNFDVTDLLESCQEASLSPAEKMEQGNEKDKQNGERPFCPIWVQLLYWLDLPSTPPLGRSAAERSQCKTQNGLR
jgi:hypothetical protein